MNKLRFIYIYLLLGSCVFTANSCSNDRANGIPALRPPADTTRLDFTAVKKELEPKLGTEFSFYEGSYFLIVSNLSGGETDNIINNTILRAAGCFYNDYFEKKPNEVTTIFLFKDDKSYRLWAKKLYDDDDLSRFGYYKPSEKVMLMNISTGTGTLVHEMTHALARYDFPEIPSWFNEGLGSLYERCSLNNNEILGYVNWRLPDLQEPIKNGSYSSLGILLKTTYDEFYGSNSSFNYAQARYLCMFLQENKLLKGFYKLFRDTYAEDNTGRKQLEKAYGSPLLNLEQDFLAWVKTLKYE